MDKVIGRNFKHLRIASSLTQDEVANALGIEHSAYSRYENGESEIPINLLEKAANLFGCESYVFFEENLSEDMILATTFKIENLNDTDMQEIIHFKEIVKSYIKMDHLADSL